MRHRGYSLIELLAAVAISGLLLLKAAPTVLSMYDVWELQNEATRLAAMLERARLRALLANTSVRFVASGAEYLIRQENLETRSFPLGAGIHFAGGSTSILFSSRGTASPGVTLNLIYKSRQVSVIISPAGRVRISP